MKFSSFIVPLMLAVSAYIYYNHAPEGGWSAMFSECKHCSHQQCPQEVVTTSLLETSSNNVQTSTPSA